MVPRNLNTLERKTVIKLLINHTITLNQKSNTPLEFKSWNITSMLLVPIPTVASYKILNQSETKT